MATTVLMPKLSDAMEEGVILRWVKKAGQEVSAGQIIAEVETDKAIIELEAHKEGVLRVILVPEEEGAPVGAPIAIIGEPDEDIEPLLRETAALTPGAGETSPHLQEAKLTQVAQERSSEEWIRVSPLARRVASDQGIDLSHVQGTGYMGRILKRDIETYVVQASTAESAPTLGGFSPSEYEEVPLRTVRKAIARRMSESKRTAPHAYLTAEIDMTKAMELRSSLNSLEKDVKITFNDLIVKAAALALTRVPEVNITFAGGAIRFHTRVHIGIDVATEDGVVTPVLRDCDRKGLGQISRETREQATKARARKLQPKDCSGATFTVSNLGMYGIENFSATIHPPEGAILAVGAMIPKPIVEGDQVVIGHPMKITLSCDQRGMDGTAGARFLMELRRILEDPLHLMM